MPPSQHPHRINLQDLRTKITKILGPGRARRYFDILGQFFSCKLSKAELDRQVTLTIEKEYVSLHNQLIWAIWSNATSNLAPPSLGESQNSKLIQSKSLPTKATGFISSHQGPQSIGEVARSDGGIVPISPRKARSDICDYKVKPKQNVPATHSKGDAFASREARTDVGRGKCWEDGVLESADLAKRSEKLHNAAKQSDSDHCSAVVPCAKRPRLALSSRMVLSTAEVTDEKSPSINFEISAKAAKEETCTRWAKTEVKAPLGIPFCVDSLGTAVKASTADKPLSLNYTLLGNRIEEECVEATDLPDVDSLHKRMECISILEGGLEGVSFECAIWLNHALDMHLKRLIGACRNLVQSRCSMNEEANAPCREKLEIGNEGLSYVRLSPVLNGIWPNFPSSGTVSVALEARKRKENCNPSITSVDFKVAMENEPQQLGENWPTLLERLSFRAFEQQDKKFSFNVEHDSQNSLELKFEHV